MNTIVLITDFGIGSPYVAEMKGAILTVNQTVRIVDGTHAIPPQDIAHGAIVLQQLATSFPPGTVFVSVVDPGVGSDRKILLVEHKGRVFIAPDNGLLSLLLDDSLVHVIDKPAFWRTNISNTFHGRDIMGPVAAHLQNGVSIKVVASPLPGEPQRLSSALADVTPIEILGEVVFIDSFGNLITNITSEQASQYQGEVAFAGTVIPRVTTYADVAKGLPVALIGSGGFLEIAVSNGNARKYFGAEIGHKIRCQQQ